jgi:uncharacterized glyoxalase superfamily protein PhnB
MSLKSATPNFFVDDVAATGGWYRDTLGFEFSLGVIAGTQDAAFEATGQPLAFAMMKCGGVELMFQSYDSVEEDLSGVSAGSGDSVALYVDVDDVDALYAELAAKVDLIVDLRDTFYGAREFHFRDCNGVLIGYATRPQRG